MNVKFRNTMYMREAVYPSVRNYVRKQASLFVRPRILETPPPSITLFYSCGSLFFSHASKTAPLLKSNSDGAAFPPSACRFPRPQTLLKRNFLSEKLTLPFCTLVALFLSNTAKQSGRFYARSEVFLSVKKCLREKLENANLSEQNHFVRVSSFFDFQMQLQMPRECFKNI